MRQSWNKNANPSFPSLSSVGKEVRGMAYSAVPHP
jgi:hypothetical protein